MLHAELITTEVEKLKMLRIQMKIYKILFTNKIIGSDKKSKKKNILDLKLMNRLTDLYYPNFNLFTTGISSSYDL